MKVLHVLDHSVPRRDGYSIRSASIVSNQMQIGIEPVVVTSARHDPASTINDEVIDGIHYYRVHPERLVPLPILNRLQAIHKMAGKIDKLVRIEQPDVLHAHSPCLWGEATARVARRHGLPFVYEIRGLWEDAAVDQGKTRRVSLR